MILSAKSDDLSDESAESDDLESPRPGYFIQSDYVPVCPLSECPLLEVPIIAGSVCETLACYTIDIVQVDCELYNYNGCELMVHSRSNCFTHSAIHSCMYTCTEVYSRLYRIISKDRSVLE